MALAIAALGLAATAGAHHSFAQFDATKQGTIKGTVRALEWNNPHVWLWVDVSDKSGVVTPWGFEGAAPGELSRHGFDKSWFHRGDAITVSYHPMRNGKPGGSFIGLILADGRKLEGGGPPQGLVAPGAGGPPPPPAKQ